MYVCLIGPPAKRDSDDGLFAGLSSIGISWREIVFTLPPYSCKARSINIRVLVDAMISSLKLQLPRLVSGFHGRVSDFFQANFV